MKKRKLSIKSKFNLILLTSLIPFAIVSAVFGFLLFRNKSYDIYEEDILSVKLSYLRLKGHEQNFLLNYPSDDVFFKTMENVYLRNFELEEKQLNQQLDELLNNQTTSILELGDKIYMIKENVDSYGDLLKVISSKIYQRGSFQTGIIGEIERSYSNAVAQHALDLPILASLKEMEVQYLNRKDPSFYNKFMTLYTNYVGSVPGSIDDINLQIVK
ncbi:MAG: hypothetical protein IJ150_05260, partial [Bacteroidales bacterium]|nr:hypothetical protein [Bacteroidales bacterium]